MAGEAKTTDFMLGDASVMLGPLADVFDLNPADHGLGLVKGVSVTSEASFVELTQGVKNTRVASVMNGNNVTANFEVYEYTARNLTYAAGLDGNGIVNVTAAGTLDANITAAATTFDVGAGEGTAFSAGQWLVIGDKDDVSVRKVVSVATDTITVDVAFVNAHTAGEAVYARNKIDIGQKDTQPYLGCKVVGTDANGKHISIIFPKIRITSGFTMGFASDDFQNMPFEMQTYDLVTSDALYSTFGGAQGFALV